MSIGSSIFLIVAGAILRFAVTGHIAGVRIHVLGLILMIVGIVLLIVSLLVALFSSASGAMARRRATRRRSRAA